MADVTTAEAGAASSGSGAETQAGAAAETALPTGFPVLEMGASAEFAKRLIDSMQDGFSLLDAEGVQLDVNRAFCEMTGFSREELIGRRPPHPYLPPEEHERILAAVAETLRGRFRNFELTMLRKNGERFPVIVSPSAIANAAGEYVNYLATVKDITERKQAEEALVAERARLRAVLDVLPISIYVKDTESRFLVVNEACARALGAAHWQEMIGRTDADYFPPALAAAFRQDELGVLEGESLLNLEEVTVAPDGTARAEMTTKVPLHDGEGKIIGLVGVSRDITEHKETNEAVRASEELLRSITDHTEDSIFVKDLASRTIFMNPAGLRATGLTMEQITGHTDAEFLDDPAQVEKFLAIDRRVMETGQTETVEEILTSATGERHVLLTAKMPRFDAEGKVIGLVGVSRDITAQKLAEAALRRASQKLRLHFEQTPMAVVEWDMEFRVTEWNPAACAIFGFSRQEALGQHASFIVPPAFHEHVDGVWQSLIEKRGGVRSTNENVRKDGRTILCEWYNTPLIDEDGTVAGVASVVVDITDNRRAQQALRESEEKFRTLFENAGDAIFLMEGDQFVDCNERTLRMFGCESRDQIVGHVPYEFSPLLQPGGRESQGLALERINAAFAGQPQFFEWVHTRLDGTPFPAEVSLNTVEVGGKALLQAIVRDISERKKAEAEIRMLNVDLERRVELRTAELSAANKEMEAFSYSVSHDLRAPLRAVHGFSRIVVEKYAERLDEDGRRMLDLIRSNAQQMGRLIDDLLAFSRLGRQALDPEPIDMHAMAQGVFLEQTLQDPARKLELDLRPLPAVGGTRAMIRQVWVNLISNAIKFTKEREVGQIEIGTRQGEDGAEIYYVKDNGAGFDMRHVGKLFGVFQRLHSMEEFDGTGVGLALVHRIVQRHGGRIWAEGEPGHGATFFFTLPNPAT